MDKQNVTENEFGNFIIAFHVYRMKESNLRKLCMAYCGFPLLCPILKNLKREILNVFKEDVCKFNSFAELHSFTRSENFLSIQVFTSHKQLRFRKIKAPHASQALPPK